MSSNPGWVELGVRSTSVLSRTWTQNNIVGEKYEEDVVNVYI